MDMNGVLHRAFDPVTNRLKTTEATPASASSLPKDQNGVWASVFDGETVRVVYV